jgi:hypothetical protein
MRCLRFACCSAPGCEFHAPLVVPHHAVNSKLDSALITHPRAIYERRAALAEFLMQTERETPEWRDRVFAIMQDLGTRQAELTKGAITGTAMGVEPENPPHRTTPVPTFTAEFDTRPPYEPAQYPNPTFA